MESLESRQLMAGNVGVKVTDGNLFVTGDVNNNTIQITPVVETSLKDRLGIPVGQVIPGRFFISGQDNTKINGHTDGQFVSGVLHNATINMFGGHDKVILASNAFKVPGDLTVNLGSGDDILTDTSIDDRMTVGGKATINGGTGKDTIVLQGNVASDLTIDSGSGNDTLYLDFMEIHGKLSINTGTDNGDDEVHTAYVDVDGDINIATGAGSDEVELFGTTSQHNISLDTGAGSDSARINLCAFDELFAKMGTGSDELTVDTCLGHKATLNGGGDHAEADVLTLRTNSIDDIIARNFI